MKLQAFKNYFIERYYILKIVLYEQIHTELQYIFDNVFSLSFSSLYTVIQLFFINVIYGNVKEIAGYDFNQMLLFTFIGQISFFSVIMFSADNVQELISMVNKGNLDLVLTKPLPTLFYITFKKLEIISFIRGLLPSLIMLSFFIKFTELNLTFLSIISGIVILICGQITLNVFMFIMGLFSFITGGGKQFLSIAWGFEYMGGRVTPFEGYGDKIKLIFLTIIPVIISTGLSTSVMLNKTDIFAGLLIAITSAVFCIYAKIILWKLALRNYSSASS